MPTRARPFLLLALAALVVAAAGPVLTGTWLLDDVYMVDCGLLGSWADVPATLWRHSGDYLAATSPEPGSAVTWRPMAMLSFALTAAVSGFEPVAFHVVGLACHLATVALLLRLAARLAGLRPLALGAVALFALHPAGIEAWGWVNGRADALAGLALAGLLNLMLADPGAVTGRTWPRALAVVGVAMAGALSKETFLVAAASVGAAAWWAADAHDRGARRALTRWHLPALGAAALAFFAGRGLVLADTQRAVLQAAGLDLAGLLARLPHIVGLGVESLVLPFPRTMRVLAWDLGRPMEVSTGVLAVAGLALVALAAARRRWPAVMLLLGAGATLAPAVLVSNAPWPGLDRYLYMPGVLLVAAAVSLGPAPDPGPERSAARARLAVLAALVPALAFAPALRGTALAYTSSRAFALATTEQRLPDGEPTGPLLLVEVGQAARDPEWMAAALAQLPPGSYPPVVADWTFSHFLRAGRPLEARALLQSSLAAAPGALDLEADLMAIDALARDLAAWLPRAQRLLATEKHRRAVAQQLPAFARAAPADAAQAAALEAVRRAVAGP